MQANRSTDSAPEKLFRSALWKAGFRGYRKNVKTLPGQPDVVFNRRKLAIFVHGCYWHGCPSCSAKRSAPKTNSEYWLAKVERNQQRFEEQTAKLEQMGWKVMIVWECHLKADVDKCIAELGLITSVQ
jgi:DNA mismatch endonuclease (patch repair protein)